MVTLTSHTSHALQPLEKQDVVGDWEQNKIMNYLHDKNEKEDEGG
jgi:hypothetical protein